MFLLLGEQAIRKLLLQTILWRFHGLIGTQKELWRKSVEMVGIGKKSMLQVILNILKI